MTETFTVLDAIDYGILKSEILVICRGRLSQRELSRRLNRPENQVYKWESGLKRLLWSDFVKVCSVCNLDLKETLQRTFCTRSIPETRNFLQTVLGDIKLSDLTHKLGISEPKIRRWLVGESEPSVEEVFAIFHEHRQRLVLFCETLVGLDKIRYLSDNLTNLKRFDELSTRHPYLISILLALRIRAVRNYGQSELADVIALYTGLDRKTVEEGFKVLVKIGLISPFDMEPLINKDPVSLGSFEDRRTKTRYWFKRGVADPDKEVKKALGIDGVLVDYVSDIVFSVSSSNHKKICALCKDTFRKISMIAQEEQNPEVVVGFVESFFTLASHPEQK